MKYVVANIVFLVAVAIASQASAQCYADYKAKQDKPLRLQYGLIELPASACGSTAAAERHAAPVIERSGWTFLLIDSILTEAEFNARKDDASAVHLRR